MTAPNGRRRRGDPPDPPPDPKRDRPQRETFFDERRLAAERAWARVLAERLMREQLPRRRERTFLMSFRIDAELDAVIDRLIPEVARLRRESVGVSPPPGRSDVLRLGVRLLLRTLLPDGG